MNQLLNIQNEKSIITMSSREIAELCGKQHSHVMRDIRHMLDELYPKMDSLDFKGIFIIKNQDTGLTSEIRLPRRETMILISGYRIDIRAKIIDRLDELENQNRPQIPSYTQALRELADQLEANELLKIESKQKDDKIESLESLFIKGETAAQFVKKLNGVNSQQVQSYLEEIGWIRWSKYGYRVLSKARDIYMTEETGQAQRHGNELFLTYSAVLLKKGAIRLYELYIQGKLPMKKTWNGQFTQNKAVGL
ncbi:Rha family transcriptional regulator [Pasteurella multocida]